MANYGLDLQQKKKSKKHRNTVFIICFLCFALLLGTVSMLLWWRSLNYDFNNLFKKDGGEAPVTVAPTEPSDEAFEGRYVFLVAVTTDGLKQTLCTELVSVDLGEKTVRVVPADKSAELDGESFEKLVATKNYQKAVEAVAKKSGADICRYAVFTESGAKSLFRLFGDLTVNIPEDVKHDTPDMFLELKRGENTLNSDQAFKYLKYVCETKSDTVASQEAANIIVAAFANYYNAENNAYSSEYYEDVFNICTDRGGSTDISIVDFTNAADAITYLVPTGSKEKLKVFVSSTVVSEDQNENER